MSKATPSTSAGTMGAVFPQSSQVAIHPPIQFHTLKRCIRIINIAIEKTKINILNIFYMEIIMYKAERAKVLNTPF